MVAFSGQLTRQATPSATPKAALALLLVGGAVASPQNLVLVSISVLVLGVIWWEALATPFRTILATYLSLQWLQSSMIVWIALAYQLDLSKPAQFRPCDTCNSLGITTMTQEAVILGLVCIGMIALGARLLEPRMRDFRPERHLRDLSPLRLFLCYIGFFAISRIAGPFVGGGLAQPIAVLGEIRFIFVVLLTFMFVTLRRGHVFLILAYGMEIGQGLIGYFAGFKTVFYFGIAALLTLYYRHSTRVRPVVVLSVVGVLSLGIIWTTIKPTFRAMLNQGSTSQTVNLSVQESFKALRTASESTKDGSWLGGLADLALRISYTEYLGSVMEYVPASKEHSGGALWADAIAFVLQPRFLFPDKPALSSDSERTMLYTGQTLASDSTGTSISIGYIGESYIDGGVPGAIGISLLLGIVYGFAANRLSSFSKGDEALYAGALTVMLQLTQQFEISNIKLLPGFLWAFIVVSAFQLAIWPTLRRMCSA